MYTIRIYNKIAQKGLDLFPRERFTISEDSDSADGILLRSYSLHDTSFPPTLKAIARAGAGVNNIPIDRCTERGIVVFNAPGANANSVKELVINALLISSRKVYEGIEWVRGLKDKGEEIPKLVEKGKSNFVGPEIKGKRLGVIGLGAVGVQVANATSALGMDVIGYDPYISIESAWGLSRAVKRASDLDSLLSTADYITIHTPLTDTTRAMLNTSAFAKMKHGVRILNFARAELVQNADILKAIEGGTVERYLTDFPDEALLRNPAVIALPHLGASTPEAEDNCAVMAAEQLRDFLVFGVIRNSVNLPNCEMRMTAGTRVLIVNRNIPNMVGQITTLLASERVNISEMINRHRGDYAYNIIDLESDPPADFKEKVMKIPGIVNARILHLPE